MLESQFPHRCMGSGEIMEKAGNPRHKQDLRVKEGFPKITTVQEPGPVWVQANGHQCTQSTRVKAEVNDLAVVSWTI